VAVDFLQYDSDRFNVPLSTVNDFTERKRFACFGDSFSSTVTLAGYSVGAPNASKPAKILVWICGVVLYVAVFLYRWALIPLIDLGEWRKVVLPGVASGESGTVLTGE
jgi:hypothetical protein